MNMLFDLGSPSDREIKILEKSGNFDLVDKILFKYSSRYKLLVEDLSIDVIFSNLRNDLLSSEDKNDWLDTAHMNLKQLTGTKNIFKKFEKMPIMLQIQLSEYFNSAKITSEHLKLRSIIESVFLVKTISFEIWLSAFKRFSISVKKSSDFVDKFWYFTDLELLVGFNLDGGLSHDDKVVKVAAWCDGEISRNENRLYYNVFSNMLKERLMSIKPNLRPTTIDDYLLNVDSWMTDGSARGFRVPIEYEGKVLKSQSKKQAIAQGMNLVELKSIMMNESNFNNTYSATEKIEPGRKGRLIISAPVGQQLRMSYVEKNLGDLIKRAFPEINFLKNSRNQLFNANVLTVESGSSSLKNKVFFPADATSFDQFVSRGEIDSCLNVLHEMIDMFVSTNLLPKDVSEVMQLIKDNFFDIPVLVSQIPTLTWQHGLPSGVKWTALLGSLINIVRYLTIVEIPDGTPFSKIKTDFITVQGDDMAIILSRLVDSMRILVQYERFNIPIHFLKNYISYTSIEFLRKVHYAGKQLAYPARLITKLCFRLPENSGSKDNLSLLQERTLSIFRLYCRNANSINCYSRMVDLVSYVLQVNKTVAKTILSSPSFLGGLSFIEPDDTFTLKGHHLVKGYKWQIIEKELGDIIVGGIYKEAADYTNAKLNIGAGTRLMKNGLIQSLSPVIKPFMHRKFQDYEASINTKVSLQLKIHISLQKNTYWRSWMLSSHLSIPNLADVVDYYRRRGDRQAILDMTDVLVYDLAYELSIKARDDVFWPWVDNTLATVSFQIEGLNDVQRSLLTDLILSSFLSRWIKTHDNINIRDYNTILYIVWGYLRANISNILSKKWLLYCTD